jgi:hypothetical protein
MAIYEIRFFDASNATLLIYVTSSDEPPEVAGMRVAEELPYTHYEIWRGRECVHAASRG